MYVCMAQKETLYMNYVQFSLLLLLCQAWLTYKLTNNKLTRTIASNSSEAVQNEFTENINEEKKSWMHKQPKKFTEQMLISHDKKY